MFAVNDRSQNTPETTPKKLFAFLPSRERGTAQVLIEHAVTETKLVSAEIRNQWIQT